MSFKFSLVSLAATCAVLASPLVASAQTLTPQRTNNTRYQTITNTQPSSENLVPNYIGVGGSNRGAALESKLALSDILSSLP